MRNTLYIILWLGIILFTGYHQAYAIVQITSCSVTADGARKELVVDIIYDGNAHNKTTIYFDDPLRDMGNITDCMNTISATNLDLTSCKDTQPNYLELHYDPVTAANTNVVVRQFNFPEIGQSFVEDVVTIKAYSNGQGGAVKSCTAFDSAPFLSPSGTISIYSYILFWYNIYVCYIFFILIFSYTNI